MGNRAAGGGGVMDYMVLRASGPAARSSKIQTMSGRDGAATLSVAKETLGDRHLAEHRRDPMVRAVARVMPTLLVAPLATGDGDAEPWGVEAMGCEDTRFSGKGVTVAVLDTGIAPEHRAFEAGPALELKDFTGTTPVDVDGHGTHCAGVIFGGSVRGRRIGVAPGVSGRMIGKVLHSGRGDTRMLFEGLNWAIAGRANVIALSLGLDLAGMISDEIEGGLPERYATSIVLDAYRENLRFFDSLIATAVNPTPFSAGAVVIAAAGNESRADLDPRYRSSPTLPAAARGVISVGALERVGGQYQVAAFSNAAPDLCAPGVNILSAGLDNGLVGMSGTSMACPHVAGAAALWWEAVCEPSPPLRPAEDVRMQIGANADGKKLGHIPVGLRGRGMVTIPQG